MSNRHNLEGTRECAYSGRSENIRGRARNACVPKEIMKNRLDHSTGSCTEVKEISRGEKGFY